MSTKASRIFSGMFLLCQNVRRFCLVVIFMLFLDIKYFKYLNIERNLLIMSSLPHFPSKVFLAPMAGVSDPALRLICRELGAGLVVTEFTSIHAVVAKERLMGDITKFVEFSPQERPLSIQLFGSDLVALRKAVEIVSPHFDIIDYNMGCPAPHVTEQMACSALLQHPDLVRNIFRTMVKATNKPVTVKIRAGV